MIAILDSGKLRHYHGILFNEKKRKIICFKRHTRGSCISLKKIEIDEVLRSAKLQKFHQ